MLLGRKNSVSEWVPISEDSLPLSTSRNSLGLAIESTFFAGDNNLNHAEVSFENYDSYLEYKVLFTETREKSKTTLMIGEIELPGLLLEPPDLAKISHLGYTMASILDNASTVTSFGCVSDDAGFNTRAIDGSTSKFICDRTGLLNVNPGIVVVPSHNTLSITQGLRVYTANNCPKCDPVK